MPRTCTIACILICVAASPLCAGCSVADWPYYSAAMPGGRILEHGWFRGTWGDEVWFTVAGTTDVGAKTICYPRNPDGTQSCHIIVAILCTGEHEVRFENASFAVRRPEQDERLDRPVAPDRMGGCDRTGPTNTQSTTVVGLVYAVPPELFALELPRVLIDDRPHAIPDITFSYQDEFPYQVVPFFAHS